ncbi:MAG: alanine--tRNA ligase [bacterium]
MTASEIRKKYIAFFKSKNHKEIPSASLLPENDPTTLFIGSGMQPLIPYLLGAPHPLGNRLVNAQKCFRAEDIEKVGDSRHSTVFEMLGNWSLGDYFKKEQLEWIFYFLTKELKLDPKRLHVTVFRGNEKLNIKKDLESVEIWKTIFSKEGIDAKDVDLAEEKGMQGGRIFYYDEKKNWWSRAGLPNDMPEGEPGGPDSEMFYDLGEDLKLHENSEFKDLPCHVNCDCGRFIEIGNNVFMQYLKTKEGFLELKKKNIDFGGGFERLVMVAQGKTNIFSTDLYSSMIKKIEELSGMRYGDNVKPFEVIADHLKAAVFIMGDDRGIRPSNTDQGYIVRRFVRRAIRFGRQLGISENLWTTKIAEIILDIYKDKYTELEKNKKFILDELNKEEEKFNNTLEKGIKIFEKLEPADQVIKGEDAFILFTTYGFPIELTEEIADSKGLKVDRDGFHKKFHEHQELSRSASAGMFKGGLADAGEQTTKYHTATHLLHQALRQVLGNHVQQKGSNITAERLRFDFSHPDKMTPEQIAKVENIVNEQIKKTLPVHCEEMTVEEAKEAGALGFFESKYGEKVKVYSIGSSIAEGGEYFSREICGGPHIKNTSELGKFKIQKEEASSAGVRRIKAVLL